jgi:hypothetical protein
VLSGNLQTPIGLADEGCVASPSLPVPALACAPERGVWLLRTVLLAVVVLVALAVAIGGRPAPTAPSSGVAFSGVQTGLVGAPHTGVGAR